MSAGQYRRNTKQSQGFSIRDSAVTKHYDEWKEGRREGGQRMRIYDDEARLSPSTITQRPARREGAA